MLRHYLKIGGEDVSGYMQSVHIERYDSGATAEFVIANIYGMFTGKWKDEGDETAKVVLLLENERHTCVGDADYRQEGAELDIEIESNSKIYHAFCGYITKVDYDEHFVKLKANTSDEFLEEEAMPDGVKPRGGTAYIATPPAEIILDVIAQHKDPPIGITILSEGAAANKGYPVLQVPRKKLPGYKPPIPPGGSQAKFPSHYEYLSPSEYERKYPNNSGRPDGWRPGTGVYGDGWYRPPEGMPRPEYPQRCKHVCRYKEQYKCCKSTECAYKQEGTLCRQVSCPYDIEKRNLCYTICPYDSGDCIDSSLTDLSECSTCGGSGSAANGAICSECGGTGLSNNKAINSALDNAQRVFDDASNRLTAAQEAYDRAETSLQKRNASIAIQKAMQDVIKARNDLNRLEKFKEQPVDEGDAEISGNPEELVYVDFWNPPIIKDQVQGVKGVKYADVIRAVQRSTGGQFFVNEECKAQFIPPNYVIPSTESAIDITHLVTRQGLAKSAMGHANIVVVYGSGITEPGASPVERERHKVVGYLHENVDSIQRHGTIHAAEVDVHYLPKQSQVEELAKNLIDFYKGDDDKAEVDAIGICPRIFQKVQWKVPIGPVMDTDECQFGSTAIMAVVSGRISKVVLDYSCQGWQVNLDVSTEGEDSGTGSMMKPYVTAGDYAFATPELYDQLEAQNQENWNRMSTVFTGSSGPTPLDPSWNSQNEDGYHLWVKPSADGKTLELVMDTGQSWGKVGDKPSGAFALRRMIGPSSLFNGEDINSLMNQSEI
jgi:hypothetical protein